MRVALAWSLAAWTAIAAVALALRAPALDHGRPAIQTLAVRDERLARCRQLGEAAGHDADCQAAWNASRARFFGRTRP